MWTYAMRAAVRLAVSASRPKWGFRRERYAVVPQLHQVAQQGLDVSCAIVSCTRDRGLVPGLEPRRFFGEDDSDAAGEAAPLGLDQVPDDFLGAPLAGRRVVGEHRLWQCG